MKKESWLSGEVEKSDFILFQRNVKMSFFSTILDDIFLKESMSVIFVLKQRELWGFFQPNLFDSFQEAKYFSKVRQLLCEKDFFQKWNLGLKNFQRKKSLFVFSLEKRDKRVQTPKLY